MGRASFKRRGMCRDEGGGGIVDPYFVVGVFEGEANFPSRMVKVLILG